MESLITITGIDISDHISLQKAPEKIIMRAGTNDISNDNYLNNNKKIMKLVEKPQRYQT